jgi:hypothetical protein
MFHGRAAIIEWDGWEDTAALCLPSYFVDLAAASANPIGILALAGDRDGSVGPVGSQP